MNIDNFTAGPAPETFDEVLRAIFIQQQKLMDTYRKIEQLPEAPLSLHLPSHQRIIKDFAWRTVEELTESAEAYEKHADVEVGQRHGLEELADSVHFFVELLIFAGVGCEQCLEYRRDWTHERFTTLQSSYWHFTYKLGIAMNFLRNKAWKQSQVPTDERRFRTALLGAYSAMVQVWVDAQQSPQDLYSYYFRKAQVNEFRQGSNY